MFRKGNYLNIGLGREDRHRLSAHVQEFVRYLQRQGKIPQDIPQKLNGHAYLLYPHAVRRMIDDQVMLIGDAAGLAYPQSGEGIRPAVESALLAARVIRACDSDYSAAQLQSYAELIEQRFGERQPGAGLMERLPFGLKQLLASGLMKTGWFTRNIVTDRWFLHAHEAPLDSAVQ